MQSKQIARKRFCHVAARNRFQGLGHVREGHWAYSLKGLWLFLAFHEVEQVRIKQTTWFCKTMSLSFSIALVFLFHVWPPSSGLQVHHWQMFIFVPTLIYSSICLFYLVLTRDISQKVRYLSPCCTDSPIPQYILTSLMSSLALSCTLCLPFSSSVKDSSLRQDASL